LKERSMTLQILPSAHPRRSTGGLAAAAQVMLAPTRRGVRSAQETIAAIGGLIWAALVYRRAFGLAAARLNGDLFDAPVLWADISAKAWEHAWRSSEQAGNWRLPLGAGALIVALALSAAVVQILI
jgi:hypothetical protein